MVFKDGRTDTLNLPDRFWNEMGMFLRLFGKIWKDGLCREFDLLTFRTIYSDTEAAFWGA